ncbi:Uncharacterized protein FWK35_00033523, partial [Aphis craccivora]
MNENWRFGKKARLKLCAPRKKRENHEKVKSYQYNEHLNDSSSSVSIFPEFETPINDRAVSDEVSNNLTLPSSSYDDGSDPWKNLEGRRIVNMRHIFNSIQLINHKGFECSFRDLEFLKEGRKGFISTFYFACKICGIKVTIDSEKDNNDININMAIVSSIVNIGQGYSQLEELTATLNMPNMSNRMYQETHTNIFNHFNDIAWKEMLLDGKEEAKLAIENGEVDYLGRPKIAVIADGAWSKRSYRTKYNALSGVACIIGARTKKCCFVDVGEKESLQITDHLCFKNWSAPSTAMEADIIVEGFKQSVSMHNLIYSQLIGDGDSSVMKRLRIEKPYGPNF